MLNVTRATLPTCDCVSGGKTRSTKSCEHPVVRLTETSQEEESWILKLGAPGTTSTAFQLAFSNGPNSQLDVNNDNKKNQRMLRLSYATSELFASFYASFFFSFKSHFCILKKKKKKEKLGNSFKMIILSV